MNIFTKPNGTELKHTTSCPRCPWKIEAAPFVPIVGGGADPRLLRYIDALKQHIEKLHPDVGMQIGAFSCFLIAAAFKLEDPLLQKMHFDLRRQLHQMTAPRIITDEMLMERAQKIAEHELLSDETRDAIAFVLRDLRDALTEQGEYGPKRAEPSPIAV